MTQRVINDSFWTDPYIEELTSDEKLIFLYLISNPLCNIAGLYEIRSKRISYETGISISFVDKILDKLLLGGKIFRVKDWILMVNFLKNQNIDNPSVRTGVNRIIKASPSYFWEALGRVYGECVDAPTYLTLLNLTLLNFTLLNSTSTLLSENKPSNFSNFKEESFEYSISKIFLQDLINRQVASVLYSLKTKSEDDIIQIWASEVSRMLRVDKLTPDQVRYVVEFTIQDDFRSTVILSMMKFRKKNSDKIPYFVVIIGKIKDSGGFEKDIDSMTGEEAIAEAKKKGLL